MPKRINGTPQLQNGGCVVIFTGYVEDSLDDVRGLFQKAEDVERTIAGLTRRRDELQAMAYARLNLLQEANRRQHRTLLELPRDIASAIGRALRQHGGRDWSHVELRDLIQQRPKEAAAVGVNSTAAA